MHRRVAVIALFCFLVSFPCRATARPAPEQVVTRIQTAIQQCDVTSFEKYVAIDLLVHNSLDVLMNHAQSICASGQELPPTLTVMALVASSEDSKLRNLLGSDLEQLIRYGVAAGLLNGQRDQTVKPEGLLTPLLAKLSTGKKILRLAGKSRQDTKLSGTWLIPVEIYEVNSKRRYPFTLHVVPAGNDWRVDGIADVDALLTRLEKSAGLTR